MTLNACSRFREDLALLAGGDLPGGPERVAAEEHAEACGACGALLESLAGDVSLFARASRQPEPEIAAASLVAPVLAHAAADAVAEGTFRPARARRRSDLGLMAFGRIAAAVALVAASAALGLAFLAHEQPAAVTAAAPWPRANDMTAQPAADMTAQPVVDVAALSAPSPLGVAEPPATGADAVTVDRPVRVHRAGGAAVALEWESDGREARAAQTPGGEGAYKVLASASARDFSGAEPVLVAGRTLVAGSDLPSMRTTDRSLTFFRVE